MIFLNTHHKQILKLGLPIAIGQVGILVQSFADTIMVGQYSTPALAAAAFVNSLFGTVLFLIMGYGFGLTPILSGFYGKGDSRQLALNFKHGLWLNLVANVLILGVMGVFYFFLDRLGQPAELLPIIRPYYITMWASMFFVGFFHVFRQLTDATLDTRTGMWILLAGNVINIIGNALLIYGLGPFPEWGAFGAGVSTLVSRILMAVMIVAVVYGRKRYAVYMQLMRQIPLDRSLFPRLHKQSYPVSLQMGMESAVFTLCTVMAGWIGTTAVAAYQALLTLSLMGYLLFVSFANSTSLRISTFVGQNDWHVVRANVKAGLQINFAIALLIAPVYYWGGHYLLRLFTSDEAVIAMGVTLMIPMIVYQVCDAMQVTRAQCLRGLSHVRAMMWLGFVGYFVVGIPACYILGIIWLNNVSGFLYGLSLALAVSVVLYRIRLRRALAYEEVGYDLSA